MAKHGPRTAASPGELRAQRALARRFRAAGLRVSYQGFHVPGKGRSRNLIGVRRGRTRCVKVVIAHADSVAGAPGANDNASGLGVLAELVTRSGLRRPRCELWFAATGAEEREFTGVPDHLGALALAKLVRRNRGRARLRWALAVDEVGREGSMVLRSPAPTQRRAVEGQFAAAARRARVGYRWQRDSSTGNSDHREFELLGLPGMKVGESDPCHHSPCDRAGRLDRVALGRTVRVVAGALAS